MDVKGDLTIEQQAECPEPPYRSCSQPNSACITTTGSSKTIVLDVLAIILWTAVAGFVTFLLCCDKKSLQDLPIAFRAVRNFSFVVSVSKTTWSKLTPAVFDYLYDTLRRNN